MRTLLLHGFLGAPAAWRDLVTRAELEAFAPWLVGHGPRPARSPGPSFDDAADDVARALPWTTPCTLVAYSMGARLALRVLLRHPHRFDRAFLLGPHAGLHDEPTRATRAAWETSLRSALVTGRGTQEPRVVAGAKGACEVHRMRANTGPRPEGERVGVRGSAPDRQREARLLQFVEAWECLPVLRVVRDVPREKLAQRRAWRLSHTPAGLAHALDVLGLARMPSSWDVLDRIALPVTLVAGASDEKFVALAHAMAARMPRASVALVPDCGHDVALEAPEELARIVRAEGSP